MENTQTGQEKTEASKDFFIRFLEANKDRNVTFIVVSLLFVFLLLSSIGLFYLCYYFGISDVWQWGIIEPKLDTVGNGFLAVGKWIVAIITCMILGVIPFMPLTFLGKYFPHALNALSNLTEKNLLRQMEEDEEKQKEYRDILEREMKNGLITLVNYSKIELDKYYTLGLLQTQKKL